MYSAIDENDLHFHLIHEKDGCRIGYQKICKAEDKPVPDDEIVKAYEFEKGEFVVLDRRGLRGGARSRACTTIEISDFVPYEEIDPIYFERTYYLGPQDGGEKVYALLREAMEEPGSPAIGKYVMRDRAAPRLPAHARRHDHAREDVLRTTRSGRSTSIAPEAREVAQGRSSRWRRR